MSHFVGFWGSDILRLVVAARTDARVMRRTLVLAFVSLLFVMLYSSPARAEGGEISLVDHTASIRVVTGDATIREGPPSTDGGGRVYRCSYFTGGHGMWHTHVRWWSELVPDELYYMHCIRDDGGVGVIARWITWDPGDPSDGEGVTNTQIRDWIGRNLLSVEAIPPTLSPANEQITGVETWLWPGGPTATQSRQASAGALSVIVEARFANMEFDPGEPDADRLACDTFVEWAPGRTESPCAHTYLHESPAAGFPLESQTNWEFWWEDVGAGGFEFYAVASPTAVQPVPVVDLEAVISARRG